MRRLSCVFVSVSAIVIASGSIESGRAGPAPTITVDQRGAALPAGQTPNPNSAPGEAGTGTISGVVIDGTTKAPLPGVVVYLGPPNHGPPGAPLRQLTDARGRFIFRGLPAHNGYFINASKFGYFDGYYGRGSSGALGARITIAEGQWFGDANLTMYRPAAINGRVVDQRNEPVVGIFVRVLTKTLVAGRHHMASGHIAKTDDRGEYRVANLFPGAYIVQVPTVQSSLPATVTMPAAPRGGGPPSLIDPTANVQAIASEGGNRLVIGPYVTPLPPENGRSRAYPPTFFPGATALAGAVEVNVAYGEDRDGIDIRLEPVPTFRISGRLDGPPDAIGSMPIRIVPVGLEELGDGSEAATTITSEDGSFVLLNVPAGTYTFEARRSVTQFESRPGSGFNPALPRPAGLPVIGSIGGSVLSAPTGTAMSSRTVPGTATHWARLALPVDRTDIRDLVVPLHRAVAMRGRLVWESEPLNSPGISLRMEPASGAPSLGTPRMTTGPAPDTFVIDGLLPGEYILTSLGPRLKSVIWDGRDYTHRPFDAAAGQDFNDVIVTLTNESILLQGTARDERGGKTLDDPAVIVFPIEPELWSNFGFSPARVKAIQTTNAGRYMFQSLPAGQYFIAAVDGEQIDGWKDPSFLKRLAPHATRISLAWGDKAEHSLRVVTIK